MRVRASFHPTSCVIYAHRGAQLSGTGYAAAAELWPEVFDGITGERRAELMAGMRAVRPRLVSGFESMVMVRTPWPSHHPPARSRNRFSNFCASGSNTFAKAHDCPPRALSCLQFCRARL